MRLGLTKPSDALGVVSGSADLLSLARRLTTIEMKELNERQRADHAARMYEQQKNALRALEDRNFELEHKFAEVRALYRGVKREVPNYPPFIFVWNTSSLRYARDACDELWSGIQVGRGTRALLWCGIYLFFPSFRNELFKERL